jgi:hypothetical protein
MPPKKATGLEENKDKDGKSGMRLRSHQQATTPAREPAAEPDELHGPAHGIKPPAADKPQSPQVTVTMPSQPPLSSEAESTKEGDDNADQLDLDGKIAAALQKQIGVLLEKFEDLPRRSSRSRQHAPPPPARGLISRIKAIKGVRSSAPSGGMVGSDDSDQDGADDDGKVDGQGDAADDSYAPSVLRNARLVGSVTQWCQLQQWNQARNKHECLALAQAMDALLSDGVGVRSLGLEIMARRLTGVHLADQHGSWDLCKAIQLPSVAETLLTHNQLSKVIREASAMQRVTTRTRNSRQPKAWQRRSRIPDNSRAGLQKPGALKK